MTWQPANEHRIFSYSLKVYWSCQYTEKWVVLGCGWWGRTFDDGTEQIAPPHDELKMPVRMFIERVVGSKSRRKLWYIVKRNPANSRHRTAKYPEKTAGPFRTLEGAKTAYLLLSSMGEHSET